MKTTVRHLLLGIAILAPLGANATTAVHRHHRHTAVSTHARALPDPVEVAKRHATAATPKLHSNEFLVLDQESSDVLLARHADLANPIASITKLMTALVVIEAAQPMDESIEITTEDENLAKPTSSRLTVGTVLTRAELLHLALMASENRAAHAICRSYPGGLAACIEAMNAKAAELQMSSTHYVEPTGLSNRNVASPEDLSRLVVAAAAVPLIKDYSTDAKFTVPVGHHLLEFHSTDRLVAKSDWDIVLQKTGYISEAGRCLVMETIIEGRSIVIVLMNSKGSQTRLVDAQRIKSWLNARATKTALMN
jgi:serine-type D-Ala-D-Ala endopeptidase (penicillin-binding protein 7)